MVGCMSELSRTEVVEWVKQVYGAAYADQRVVEGPAAFSVNVDPEAGPGAGALVVRKRTGEYWHLPDDQVAFVHTAKSDRRLLRALRNVVADVHWPMGVVKDGSLGSAEDRLAEWLRATRGWRTIDGRIRDLGWAFAVSPQPDAYHDGNQLAMMYGVGPLIAVKRSGAVWALSSTPTESSLVGAKNEAEFHRLVGEVSPNLQPTEWAQL